MEELIKNKKKLIATGFAAILTILVSIVLLFSFAPIFKGEASVLILLLLFVLLIPLNISMAVTGVKVINEILFGERKMSVLHDTEIEQMDKEVEKKAKEADEISLSLSKLKDALSGITDWERFGQSLLTAVSKQMEMVIGIVYKFNGTEYNSVATYSYFADKTPPSFKEGEGINGQVVKDKKAIFLSDVPKGYVQVISGLGNEKPSNLMLLPLIKNDIAVGVIEIATFKKVGKGIIMGADEISNFIGNLTPEI